MKLRNRQPAHPTRIDRAITCDRQHRATVQARLAAVEVIRCPCCDYPVTDVDEGCPVCNPDTGDDPEVWSA